MLNALFTGFLLLLVSSCSSSSLDSKSTASTELKFKVDDFTLANGLKVIMVQNKKLPIFSYYTFYQVGGKFEYPGITGASHFLEHMMFKGAKKYGAGEFDKLVEGNGGSNNAYTTNDLTVYYENMPSDQLSQIIDIEADRMENLTLEEQSFENERSVVLSERKSRYENSDQGKIYLAMMKSVFEGTPYGTSVIGEKKDIQTVTRDQIYEYFKKFYSPNNAIIIIAGDIDFEQVRDEIKEKFGKIKPFKGLDELKEKTISDRKGYSFKGKFNRWVKLNGSSNNPQIMLAYQGIKVGPREAYVLDILSSILGDGKSSYLGQEMVSNKKPIFTNISVANYTLQDSGVFFVSAGLLGGKSLNHAKKALYKEIARGCDEAINARSLQKIKNKYLIDMLSNFELNSGVARFLGDREVFYGDYNFYKKELEIYQSITEEELKKACHDYLKPEKSIFLSIWDKHPKNKMEL